MKWFTKLFGKSKDNLYHVKYEKSHVTVLFEDLEQNYAKKKRMQTHCEDLHKKEEALKQYEKLTSEDLEQLVVLGGQHKAAQEKRSLLRSRLIKNNAALNRLEPYEEELPEMIQELSSVERQFKDSERDLFYLDEEREMLREDREMLLKGYGFLKGFSMVLLGVMVALLFIVFALMQTLREAVWIYLSSIGCALVFFVMGILYAKEKIEHALRDNEILQKKAARYSQKAKIRCFNNKNYLDFQFAKLGVDSVAKLEMYYNRYLKSKSNEQSYANLTRGLIQIERKLEDLFEARGIEVNDFEDMEEWFLAPKRAKTLEGVVIEHQKAKEQVRAMTVYEEELWKEIYALEQVETTRELVAQKIREYKEAILILDKKTKSA
ncbi:MAG: hypothetical protein ACRCTE_04735 [Cellulosilyticaceae bacterium]